MLTRHLYLKISLTVTGALILFALLAILMWKFVGHDQFARQLFDRTSSLATLLLPALGAEEETNQRATNAIADRLQIDIAVFDAQGRLLADSGSGLGLPESTLQPGAWIPSNVETRWATALSDGRLMVIDLKQPAATSESLGLALALAALALLISLIMYPFIRNLTSRLERLKASVEQIGSGYLGARVEVEGRDEIADLAVSFNQAADHIEQLVDSQRMLLANASHELRTPLARIRLGIELLKEDKDGTRSAALGNDIQELDALIDEVILMTRLDTGHGTLDNEPIDFVALVAEECARYPDCTFCATQAELTGDARMLRHMVRNLIDNACKHGQPPIYVAVRLNGSTIHFSVSDAGEGIAEADRSRVFDPFYRAKTRQNTSGSGLGLALVKKITLAHKGEVVISPSKTSSIVVTLPC